MGKYLWMAVEADEYELPIAIADTARELAEKCGTSLSNVETSIYYGSSGSTTGRKFVKVRNEE